MKRCWQRQYRYFQHFIKSLHACFGFFENSIKTFHWCPMRQQGVLYLFSYVFPQVVCVIWYLRNYCILLYKTVMGCEENYVNHLFFSLSRWDPAERCGSTPLKGHLQTHPESPHGGGYQSSCKNPQGVGKPSSTCDDPILLTNQTWKLGDVT